MLISNILENYLTWICFSDKKCDTVDTISMKKPVSLKKARRN